MRQFIFESVAAILLGFTLHTFTDNVYGSVLGALTCLMVLLSIDGLAYSLAKAIAASCRS